MQRRSAGDKAIESESISNAKIRDGSVELCIIEKILLT